MSSEVEREEYDVIIIGGGIGGLYTAWRLGTSTDLKVLVLEGSDRFGGRFMSCEMPGGYIADLGAMRYSPDMHRILHKLVQHLKIPMATIEDLHGNVPHNKFKFYERNKQLTSLEEIRAMYSIRDEDLSHFLSANKFRFPNHPEELNLAKSPDGNLSTSTDRHSGQLAKDISVGQYLLQTDNAELLNFGMHSYPPPEWQLAVAAGKINLVAKNWNAIKAPEQGFGGIAAALVSQLAILKNVTLKHSQAVTSITELPTYFEVNVPHHLAVYQCQKVIYACSEVGLRKITLNGAAFRQERIREMLNKVFVVPGFKLFLTYKRAWWEDCSVYQGTITTDLPINETVVFGPCAKSDSHATILAAYTYRNPEFFRSLDIECNERFANAEGNISEKMTPSKRLVEHVDRQLKHTMGCPSLPEDPVCALKMFWGTNDVPGMSYPAKIGVDSNQLHWESLKPFDDADIFITGDTFPAWDRRGVYLGFSESTLLTSERILVNHFGLEPFLDGLCLQNPWPKQDL